MRLVVVEVLFGAVLFASSCGAPATGPASSDSGPAVTDVASYLPTESSTPPVPTTTAGPTTTVPAATVPPTTAPATTVPPTTVPPTLVFDDEGVPVNAQSSGVLLTPTGWVVPVLGAIESGWRVWTPCGREADLATGELVESVDFVLDPGHGGAEEPGAVGAAGTREADINLAVATRVKDALVADGYTVLMTRDSDVRVPIVTRAEIALALDPIAFISIHHNAGTDRVSSEPGTEMWFQGESAESRRLAGLILEETRRVLALFGTDWFAMADAGAMARENRSGLDYYGVLRRPQGVTSVLAEYAYISNPAEEALLNRTDVQDGLAEATRVAVDRFVNSSDTGSGFTDPEEQIFRGFAPRGAGRTTNCTDPALVS